MPPLNRIDAVTLHNTQHWPSGRWIPMRFEVNSWVTLNPDPNSLWGRDSCRYAVGSLQYLWKAQILGFEFRGDDGNLVSRVKVRHAYEPRQLNLDPAQPRPRIPCNYLFPAYFDDWVLAALKPTTGSRQSHCQWWMPITVFIDLFASARNIVRSPTLYTLKDIEAHIFSDIMDSGWHTKTTDEGDIIRCTISFDSIVFRYYIARQTLYANFFFTRERYVGQRWTQMEQDKTTRLVQLECQVPEAIPPNSMFFNVGTDWPVAHLRNEVQINMGEEAPAEFFFCYRDPIGTVDHKINRRKEKSMIVADILPPRVLKIRTC